MGKFTNARGLPSSTRRHMLVWRRDYRNSRFLEHLSDGEIIDRRKSLLRNVYRLAEAEKIYGKCLEQIRTAIWQSLIETTEEIRLRQRLFRFPPGELTELRTAGATYDFLAAANNVVRQVQFQPGKMLVRYSERQYLEHAIDAGEIRVSPAHSYNDSSYAFAVHDNELEREIAGFPLDVHLHHITSGRTSVVKTPVRLSTRLAGDYYVLSLSSLLLPSLLWEFCAPDPACLVIHDPDRFFREVAHAFRQTVGDWKIAMSEVTYVDTPGEDYPSDLPNRDLLFFLKDQRYTFEAEVRIVGCPPQPISHLEHVFLHVPDLHEYVELISVSPR